MRSRATIIRGLIVLLLVSVVLLPTRSPHTARAMTARGVYGGTIIATTASDPGDFDPAISYG